MNSGVARKHKSSLLWRAWEKTLARDGKRIALIEATDARSFTSDELNEGVLKQVDLLSGFESGTRIAFCLPNGVAWIALFLALQKLGLAAIPLDAGLPESTSLDIARHLRCRALFYRGKFHLVDNVSRRSKMICCIKVTSGTSAGIPNHVPCRAEHLLADGANLIRTMGIRPNDRNLASIPLGHSYGLGNLVLPLILQGTALVCASQFVPRQLVEWIGLHRVAVFPCVPAIFRVLAAMPGDSKLEPLRLAISAGAPLSREVARAFYERYHVKLHNFYGSSETGGICYDKTGIATLQGRSVGKPVSGVSVTAREGTILVSSKAVAKRNGQWRMPDHGEWNAKGELVLHGRSGREVNIGGKKVHPSEVERALRSISGVSDVIVWEAGNADRAFLQAGVETTLPLREIQTSLSLKLPEWKLPKHYVVAAELPRSERGKIDFAAVRRKLETQLR